LWQPTRWPLGELALFLLLAGQQLGRGLLLGPLAAALSRLLGRFDEPLQLACRNAGWAVHGHNLADAQIVLPLRRKLRSVVGEKDIDQGIAWLQPLQPQPVSEPQHQMIVERTAGQAGRAAVERVG
jgi:hypothetical protein